MDVDQCCPHYRSPGYLHILSTKEFRKSECKVKKEQEGGKQAEICKTNTIREVIFCKN